MDKVKVFLSYCWNDSEEADKIYDYFIAKYNIELYRDKIDVKKWGSIKEYMESIESMDYTILLISDSYLKSVNCMYEVLEVMKDKNYREKIFPAIIDTRIYDSIIKIDYVKYWEDEFKKMEEKLSILSVQNLGRFPEELKRRQNISSNIAEFLNTISDMNNPKVKDICKEIEKKLVAKNLLEYNKKSLFEIAKEKNTARIIVVGVGNEGNNIVNRMIYENIEGVEFIGIDTDKQYLQLCKATTVIQIGEKMTKGLNAGTRPEIGQKAAEESSEDIAVAIKGADIVFVICGMGGGTGTGAAPVVAKLSKEMGILTVGIVTKPFYYEGYMRINNSNVGINKMKDNADSLIVISNDNLYEFINKHLVVSRVSMIIDEIFLQMVKAMADLINIPALVNLDIEDIRYIMENKGIIYLGIGKGKGDNKVSNAVKMAAEIPFLESTISGSSNVIINISGDISLLDANDAASYVQDLAGENANVIFGIRYDEGEIDSCTVTIIATGMKCN